MSLLFFGPKRGREDDADDEDEDYEDAEDEETEDDDEEEDEEEEVVLPRQPPAALDLLAGMDDDVDDEFAPYQTLQLSDEQTAFFAEAGYTLQDLFNLAQPVGRFDDVNERLMKALFPSVFHLRDRPVVLNMATLSTIERYRKLAASYLRKKGISTTLSHVLNPKTGIVTADQISAARAEFGDTPLKRMLMALDEHENSEL